MLQPFQKYIEQYRIFSPADKILVGVSGGVDSVTLLHLLLLSGYKVGVAHCNFALRGQESDGDEDFVRDFCSHSKIPFFAKRFDTAGHANAHGISIQMAARDLRYAWFEQLMSEQVFSKVAVAHNLNDDVETFLLNLTRGTGLRGLIGMAPLHGRVARPLLFASREEIMLHVARHGLRYREDSSNSSLKYARNLVRHKVAPELQSINPSFLNTMQRNMERLNIAQRFIGKTADEIRKKTFSGNAEMLRISIEQLPKEQRGFWLFELLHDFGFSSAGVESIAQSLEGESGKRFYSPTHVLVKDRDCLIISPRKHAVTQHELVLEQDAVYAGVQVSLNDGRLLQLNPVNDSEVNFTLGEHAAFLDLGKLQFPLTLRRWHSGDSFIPFGMTGKKKLSDFFIDAKLNLLEKQEQLLLCSANGDVLWVVGHRPDNRCCITPQTRSVLRVEVK